MRKLTTDQARQMAQTRSRKSGGSNGGRPRSKDRCACGAMTRERARKRRHVCNA